MLMTMMSKPISDLINRHLPAKQIVSITALLGGDLNETMLVQLVTGESFVSSPAMRAA